MSESRQRPPFRADHVGSLLRPPWLLEAREEHRQGRLEGPELAELEDRAIREVVAMQQDIGLKAVTDGEFRRNLWHVDFLKQFANVSVTRSPVKVNFHTEEGDIERRPSALRVEGKLGRPHPIFVDHYRFLHSVAEAVPKITLPSPSILHFRGGRGAVDEDAYPDMAEFFADLARVYSEEVKALADAGCRYLQLDEVNFAYLCDPALRRQVRDLGEDPDALPLIYADLINGAIASRPAGMAVTMHLCRGNFEGAWLAEGGYEPVAEVLFNAINVDGYFLEYDTDRAGDFSPLRRVPTGKTVVLGLVSSKRGEPESGEDLKRRIDAAARYLPLDQLALSPQCGFASGEKGNKLSIDEEKAGSIFIQPQTTTGM
ncbi:MAG: 5-methyltetrahydropteroyltriglutamate--homocysteine S-methyltransferase [Gammaproteobacteria bacterium]